MILNSSINKLFFYKIPSVLFCLIPIFLITGPFLTDLAVTIICIIFLIYCFKVRNFSYFKSKYFLYFFIFWLYLCLNSLFNNFNLDSLRISFFSIRYAIFVVSIVALLKFDDHFLKIFSILFCYALHF